MGEHTIGLLTWQELHDNLGGPNRWMVTATCSCGVELGMQTTAILPHAAVVRDNLRFHHVEHGGKCLAVSNG